MRYKNMKIRLFILALLVAPVVKAQQPYTPEGLDAPVKVAAFQSGEKLTYVLGWELKGLMNASAGEVVFKTSLTTIDNKPAYRIHASGKTLPNLRFIYDLDDTYETWLDMSTLRPLKFRSELKENKYRYKAEYTYDWDNMKVSTHYHNLRKSPQTAEMDLTENSADAVAFFFKLRSMDIGALTPGEYQSFDFVMDKKIRSIRFKLLGRENRKLGKAGTFKTLKLSCELTSTDDKDGQTFEEGTEFFLWLSDDKNHIPLYIESPTKIGSVVATIKSYEGLKYPIDSKVK